MNSSVIRYAIRGATLIQSSFEFDRSKPSFSNILKYFNRMGLTSKEIASYGAPSRDSKSVKSDEPEEIEQIQNAVEELCIEINNTLKYDEKIFLLLLIQDCLIHLSDISGYVDLLSVIYDHIGIDTNLIGKFEEFLGNDDLEAFDGKDYLVLSPPKEAEDEKLEGSWIESNVPRNRQTINLLEIDRVYDHLIIMLVDQIKSFLVRCLDNSSRQFSRDDDYKCRFRILNPGTELCLQGGTILTYTQIKKQFLQLHPKGPVSLTATDVKFRSSRGFKEINRFTASEASGQIIGIVGKEGVGKSTLLKLLAGQFKPDSGNIIINGYDLWRYKYLLKGIIGYVPEEDLLIEELTVFENLVLTARLHYSSLGKKDIETKVDKLLQKLDLYELKHEVVGNIFTKHIQPGQRRMLNIALELLREPHILLVDNALYGLGMADASKVIKILHDYTFGGNLVITTISQSSSHTFSYFDKIWIIDEGGRLVYNGSIKDATVYLYRHLNLVHRNMQDVDPSVLLDLINYKLPDPKSKIWKRVIDPQKWHELYFEEKAPEPYSTPNKTLLPARILKIPNLEVQLLIFSIRNLKSKFTRLRDIIITFLSGPLVGLVMALLLKMHTDGEYVFADNSNIYLFQFLSVVIAIFIGIIISSNEFIKERNILKKEEYLEFSRFSYINSKILYLFSLIALQIFLYVITSNYILEIRGMTLYYWIVLFSSGCFGILVGLFFSMSVKHIGVIYEKLIPIVLALQVVLGGCIIPYENLNLGKGKYSPLLGDLMVSRWGYEALAVIQFKSNKYEEFFFDVDKRLSEASYHFTQLVPALEGMLDKCVSAGENTDSVAFYCSILHNALSKIAGYPDIFEFEYLKNIQELKDNEMVLEEVRGYLTYLSRYFYNEYEAAYQEKESLQAQLVDSIGSVAFQDFRRNYYNEKLEVIVRQLDHEQAFEIIPPEIIQQIDPVFTEPDSDYGRASFFSSAKFINGQLTNTIWFNVFIIWMFTFLFYLLLLFDATNFIRKLFHADPV